jgi:hypothetical protein
VWNISQAFRQELRSPNQQTAARAQLLDADFKEIPDGDFFTAGADDFQDFIVDGNVDIDITRGTRRTAELTLLNENGNFTPDGTAADYDGKFYVNRNVRLYRGVVLSGGTTIYAPIGTFMIDSIDVLIERNMSLMNMTLSDHWKKLEKSLITFTGSHPVGTQINTSIKSLAGYAGADYPLAPALDPLTGRSSTTLTTALKFERGTSRGDLLKEISTKYGIDIYFNQEGRLVSNDRKNPKDAQEVWHFYSSSSTISSGMLVSVRRTLSDDNLANHIFVIGTGNPTSPVIYEARMTTASNPFNVDRIGDRVKILEGNWKTQAQVDAAGAKLWDTKYNLAEEVVIDTICNPALEGDDVIRITHPYAKLDDVYRIASMNVPLTTSKQTIRCIRNVYA